MNEHKEPGMMLDLTASGLRRTIFRSRSLKALMLHWSTDRDRLALMEGYAAHTWPDGLPDLRSVCRSHAYVYLHIQNHTSGGVECDSFIHCSLTQTQRTTYFHALFLQALRSEWGGASSGQWTPPPLPWFSPFYEKVISCTLSLRAPSLNY